MGLLGFFWPIWLTVGLGIILLIISFPISKKIRKNLKAKKERKELSENTDSKNLEVIKNDE
ncbi:hypothetical protein [Mesomycoplasma lagogenitalium]|uniref:Uncharacterized protein n=1 Tax=Mesomycoplasma lagogenitalium TaxID=171286 RepID=A0ABY8LUL2_9BACT|nr:hypothetical protein [Mesomycoplasma lagogenitalium]WGI36922.1 hypothetical protein QEG99_01410 [Mesomycoplasma lagogenitalium]